jgi:M6 family metalloprotease-like protein
MFPKRAGILVILLLATISLNATEPPRGGGELPDAYLQRLRDQPHAFSFRHALMPYVQSVLQARAAALGGITQNFSEMIALGQTSVPAPSTRVEGVRHAPVLLVEFSDTTSDPEGNPLYNPAALQKRLFGPSPNLTIPEFYKQMSHGLFTVDGTVYAWTKLSHPESYYVGQDYKVKGKLKHCFGLCNTSKMGELIKEVLDAHPEIPWEQYDNDGPDGVPNSGDDDGYVDFVAFVQPSTGGECNDGNTHIWSYRYNLVGLTGQEYQTQRKSASGGFIKIVDYTIQPAYSCDGADVNQIGVFAHEFGHAFGLPDLYDTTNSSGGIGNWCLMAGGSWGGDGNSPDQPVQMSAWAKEFLGWVDPIVVNADGPATSVPSYESPPLPNGDKRVIRYQVSNNRYYLIDNIQPKLSDTKLPGSGLQIWAINVSAVTSGMKTNRVNADPTNRGVALIEADGLRRLDAPPSANGSLFSGSADDLFPGSGRFRNFDNNSPAASVGNFSICNISDASDVMQIDVQVFSGVCPQTISRAQPFPPAASPVESRSPSPQHSTDKASDTSTNAAPVAEIKANLNTYVDRQVSLTGTIINIGQNLQLRSQRHLILKDAKGEEIDVRIPVVTEVVPEHGSISSPSNAAQVLDEPVKVTGKVEKDKDGRARIAIETVEPVSPHKQ